MFLMMGEYRALGEVPDCDGKISRNFSAQGAFAFALPSCVVRVDRLRRDKNARRDRQGQSATVRPPDGCTDVIRTAPECQTTAGALADGGPAVIG